MKPIFENELDLDETPIIIENPEDDYHYTCKWCFGKQKHRASCHSGRAAKLFILICFEKVNENTEKLKILAFVCDRSNQ